MDNRTIEEVRKNETKLINEIEPLYSDDCAIFPISTFFKEKLLNELKEK